MPALQSGGRSREDDRSGRRPGDSRRGADGTKPTTGTYRRAVRSMRSMSSGNPAADRRGRSRLVGRGEAIAADVEASNVMLRSSRPTTRLRRFGARGWARPSTATARVATASRSSRTSSAHCRLASCRAARDWTIGAPAARLEPVGHGITGGRGVALRFGIRAFRLPGRLELFLPRVVGGIRPVVGPKNSPRASTVVYTGHYWRGMKED